MLSTARTHSNRHRALLIFGAHARIRTRNAPVGKILIKLRWLKSFSKEVGPGAATFIYECVECGEYRL